MNTNEQADRAKALRKALGLNQKEFAESIDYTQGYITMIEHGKRWFSKKALRNIQTIYPQVNIDYLESGHGEILKEVENKPSQIQQVIKNQPSQMAVTKNKNYGNPNLQVLTVPVNQENEEFVLVVPDYALAGYTNNYSDPEWVAQLPVETVPQDLKNRGTIAKFKVYGDSMETNFHHGDYIYCSYVDIRDYEDFRFKIRNGYVYVVVAEGRAPMLKRLYYHDKDAFLQCYSDNEDQKRFEPFAIPLSEIKQVWYWRRTYTAQAPKPVFKREELIEVKRNLFETTEKVNAMESDIKEAKEGIEEIKNMLTQNKKDTD